MARLYHSRFSRWIRGENGMPRFIYEPGLGDGLVCVQTFRCQSCGEVIHVDTDRVDKDGGFIGNSIQPNQSASKEVRV